MRYSYIIKEMEDINMKGSEKQIKWASEIMDNALAAIESIKNTRKHYDDVDGRRNSDLYDITWEAIEAVEAEYTKAFQEVEDAGIVIDNRDRLTGAAIRDHARDWMRFHGSEISKSEEKTMTRETLIERVRSANGAYNWLVIHDHLDKADTAIDTVMDNLANPFPYPMLGKSVVDDDDTVTSTAEHLGGIVADTVAASLDRTDALTLLRVLQVSRDLTICDGVTMTETDLLWRWSRTHEGEKAISAGDYQSMLEI